jgi:hypothetical protein
MMCHEIVAGVAFGCCCILVGDVVLEKQQPYLRPSYHSHVDLPEGTTRNFSSWGHFDSGAATNTASTGVLNIIPALALAE